MTATSKSLEQDAPTIVIADDHEIYRRGLKLFLEHEGMRVVASAATGKQAVEATTKHSPDILLLDIAMPDLDGLGVLAIVKYIAPKTSVIILTALDDQTYISRARELGADGYLSKGVDNDYLIEAIRGIAGRNEEVVFTKTVPTPTAPKELSLLFPNDHEESSNGKGLTDKETLILSLISMGIDNQGIAEKLTITKNTLKTHTRKIYSKLGVSDRSQAAIWALRNGF
jgi:DNA-binding NarL/FixJ family response regulator